MFPSFSERPEGMVIKIFLGPFSSPAYASAISDHTDVTEAQIEYMNQSRQSNIRITGVAEDKNVEKSWDDTEKVVKQVIKDKLNLQEDFEIERCHRVN